MTLPRGFGGYNRMCSVCGSDKDADHKCRNPYCIMYKSHYQIKDEMSDGKAALIIIGVIIIIATALIIGAYMWNEANIIEHDKIHTIIEGLGCYDLAEYIADYKEHYDYADHRYEWLCVNEQVKEFQ